MKTTTQFVAALLALMVGFSASATVLFTEEFSPAYGDGTVLGTDVTTGGWNTKWPNGNSAGSGGAVCTSAGDLTFPTLAPIVETPTYGLQISSGNSRRLAAPFASQSGDGTTVYLSFLIKVTADTPVARQLAGFRNSTGGGNQAAAVGISATRQLTIYKNTSNVAATHGTVLNQNQTYFVVLRLRFQSGSDEVALWLDPVTGGADEAAAGVTPTTTTANSDQSSVLSLQLPAVADASGPLYLDEIRIGTAWTEVTPAAGPALGAKLGFTTQPAGAEPGATLAPVIVQVQSATGVAAASNGVPVTLTLTSGSGTLNGTLTQNTAANGQATFSDLSLDTAGIKQLTAAASGIGAGLTNAVSTTFTIAVVPVATKLTFTVQPADGVVNTTLSGVTVQIQDPSGLPVASNAVPITLTLSAGSGTLGGTLTRNTDGTGKAIFNDLTLDTDGTGKQLTASAAGGIGDGLADAVSNPFNITLTPVGAKLAFTTQPSSAPANAALADIVVQIQDNQSAAVASNGVPVTLALTLGSGTLNGTATQNTDSTGKATFSGLSIDLPGAAKQLTASASGSGAGLAAAPSAIFAITTPAFTGPPVITQAVMAASSMILRGTNGTPGGEYHVLSATNVTQPVAGWASVLTNTFKGNGSFDCTNAVSSASEQGFFRLLALSSGDTLPDFGHYGFASMDSSGNVYNLTGGTNGSFPQDNIVTVSNFAQLGDAISNSAPLIIQVVGEIYMRTNGNFYVRANKTILGLDTNATLVGCLGLYGNASGGMPYACSNVIIRNITLRNPNQYGEDDGIAIKYGGHHIWVDHCTIHDIYDGALDITRESDFVTVSWCKFYYTSVNSHGDTVDLIGGADDDTTDLGKLHVTFHHNWWGALARERIPSVRFGRVHVYNNYYNCVGNHYCARARLYSEVLVENNYFDTVYNPWEVATSSLGPNGLLRAIGNITNNCTFSTTHYDPNLPNGGVVLLVPGDDVLSSGVNQLNPPPYNYPVDAALNVPTLVQTHAGAGRRPFAP